MTVKEFLIFQVFDDDICPDLIILGQRNDVLDYAKLESGGNFETVVRQTNLQNNLCTVVHSISQKARPRNITLQTRDSANLPKLVETDGRRLQQVLFNLLGNATKFSDDGSVVDLTVSLARSDSGREDGPFDIIRFCVKD